MKTELQKKGIITSAIFTVALTIFIFMNSLQMGEDSAKMSAGITQLVVDAINSIGFDMELADLHFFIRKVGHFSEYFALGLASSVLLNCIFDSKRFMAISPAYCLTIAICDEFIMQGITAGRHPAWTDVLIDTSGAICACIGVLLLVKYLKRRKPKKTGQDSRED